MSEFCTIRLVTNENGTAERMLDFKPQVSQQELLQYAHNFSSVVGRRISPGGFYESLKNSLPACIVDGTGIHLSVHGYEVASLTESGIVIHAENLPEIQDQFIWDNRCGVPRIETLEPGIDQISVVFRGDEDDELMRNSIALYGHARLGYTQELLDREYYRNWMSQIQAVPLFGHSRVALVGPNPTFDRLGIGVSFGMQSYEKR